MTRKLLAAGLATALLAVACGDSSETTTTEATAGTTETTPEPATTSTDTPPPATQPAGGGPTFTWAGVKFDVAVFEPCFGGPGCLDSTAADEASVQLKRELYGQLLERNREVAFRAPPGEQNTGIGIEASRFCAYHPRYILHLEDVERGLLGDGVIVDGDVEFVGTLPPGVAATPVVPGEDPYEVVVAILQANPGLNGMVGLNYIYLPAPRWKWGPGSDPFPVGSPPAQQPEFGGSADVLVFDVFGPRDAFNGIDDPVERHGEFIFDIVDQLGVAPTAMSVEDDTTELITDLTLYEATSNDDVKAAVINASFGIYPCEFESDETPTGLETIQPFVLTMTLQAIENRDVVLVAAAGNDGHDAEGLAFLPAALATVEGFSDYVVSVGAFDPRHVDPQSGFDYSDRSRFLDETGKAVTVSNGGAVADFSNRSAWVEVYAPGVFVPADYGGGTFIYTYEGISDFSDVAGFIKDVDDALSTGANAPSKMAAMADSIPNLAQWSGTSFAVPYVAAAIAAAAVGGSSVRGACADVFGDLVCRPPEP